MPQDNDPKTKDTQELEQALVPLVMDLRARRKPLEERWLLYNAHYTGRHTRTFFNSEMFRHFIPAARRAVERFVIRGTQMVIPSADFFEVYPGDEYGDQSGNEAEAVRCVMSWLVRKRIKSYPFVRQAFRSYACYGRAIVKTGIEEVHAKVRRGKGQPLEEVSQVWPTWRVVDPFYFYTWPETQVEVGRLQIMAEDIMLPWDTYEQMMKRQLVEKVDQADLTTPVWPEHHVRRLQQQNFTDPSTINVGGEEEVKNRLVGFVAITEVWCRYKGQWRRLWLAWNIKGHDGQVVRNNPHPFPVPPYRIVSARDLPGEGYGTSMMDDLEPLGVLLNDQMNMGLEGQATNFSPPVVVDPNRVFRSSSLTFRPRAKWLADPEGIKFFEPRDITKYAFQGIQFTLGLMDSFSGSNPLAEGQPTRNLPRAGFAVSSLLNLSLADIKDAAQMIEDMLLTPLLGDTFRLLVEYADPQQIISIPGSQDWPARRFTVNQLYGDWDFQWVGSIQFQDMQVKAQRMVAFAGLIFKGLDVVSADLARRGKKLNIEAIVKRIWRDSLGERGVDRIIEEMSPEEIQMMQQQQMLMMGQGPRPQGGGGQPPSYPASREAAGRQQGRQISETQAGGVTGPGGV